MNHKSDLSGLRIDRSTGPEQTAIPMQKRKWFTRLALPIGILIATLVLLGYAARDSLSPAVNVRTVRVVSKSLAHSPGTVTVQAPGWVEPDPFAIYVPALAAGVVEEVLVLEGQSVTAGQVVVRMIKDDAQLALDLARAKLENTQAQLKAAQSDWDYPIELDRTINVYEAQVKQIDAERTQLTAEIAMQEAKLAELKDRYQRLEAVTDNAVSEQQVVEAKLQFNAQQAVVEAAEKKLDVLGARYAGTQADLHAAREHRRLRIPEQKALDLTKAQLHEMQAAVAQAELRLERMDVRTPASGIVMKRLVVPGSKLMLNMDNKLSANAIHLYDPAKLQVRVDVPLADAAKVGLEQEAEIVVDVLPDRRYAGKVTRIVHEADIQKNTLEVKVAIDNPTEELKPEMLARVKFLGRSQSDTGQTASRVLVPKRILEQRSGNTAAVWVAAVDRRAAKREITLGRHEEAGWVETISGLQPGDTLIAESEKTLKEGQRIKITGEIEP